ncbi:hypothetical protein BZB76_1058 [Actinomadura pelletieri DSM 43383]|uniref:Uncharacterized protein n=1 Tax=Actinomadura pelletieri DSM 43383 TaxID=1120940 RepID=A0A495R041_9ACTN|nr:hypothetical protein BZB76_1058 [Actinomadura pelletieri DSM 43383]
MRALRRSWVEVCSSSASGVGGASGWFRAGCCAAAVSVVCSAGCGAGGVVRWAAGPVDVAAACARGGVFPWPCPAWLGCWWVSPGGRLPCRSRFHRQGVGDHRKPRGSDRPQPRTHLSHAVAIVGRNHRRLIRSKIRTVQARPICLLTSAATSRPSTPVQGHPTPLLAPPLAPAPVPEGAPARTARRCDRQFRANEHPGSRGPGGGAAPWFELAQAALETPSRRALSKAGRVTPLGALIDPTCRLRSLRAGLPAL